MLDGGAGDDTLFGGDGNDTLIGGAGADRLDGGAGFDATSYAGLAEGLVIDLSGQGGADQPRNAGAAAGDVLLGIEEITGTAHADVMVMEGAAAGGTTGPANILRGEGGADWLAGGSGNDWLFGGEGDDTLLGGSGFDRVEGGLGVDVASYGDAAAGVVVDLVVPAANLGDARGDVLVGIEGLEGSGFADTLLGDGWANGLWGGAGHDRLEGRAGNDTLMGVRATTRWWAVLAMMCSMAARGRTGPAGRT